MAIVHDASTDGGAISGAGTSLTFSHTVGAGTSRFLKVGVTLETGSGDTQRDVSTVTYDGVACARAVTVEETAEASKLRVELWYILAPGSGANDVVITLSGALGSGSTLIGDATSVTGAAQSTPEATNSSHTAVDGSTVSTGITTLTDGAWVFDAAGGGTIQLATANAGQTERTDQTAGGAAGAALAGSTKPVATAGATTLGWTWAASQPRNAHALAAWAPAPPIVTGTAAGAATGSGTATGTRTVLGAGAGAATGAGAASGTRNVLGTATGAATGTGSATGLRTVTGTGAGAAVGAGTATGARTTFGVAAGAATSSGTATGSIEGEEPEPEPPEPEEPSQGGSGRKQREAHRQQLIRDDEDLLTIVGAL